MPKRIRRNRKLNAEEVARLREARAEFSGRPSKAQLLQSGDYAGPMSIEQYLSWRKGAGDVPLARQLQAAIASTGQSRYSIAQASGVAAPVLQRFVGRPSRDHAGDGRQTGRLPGRGPLARAPQRTLAGRGPAR